MAEPFVILIVCAGNIHRSPLAAALLRTWADWYLPTELSPQVEIGSAGFIAPVGARMGPRPLAIAAALGADGTAHRASALTDDKIAAADLVLTASTAQRDEVLSRVPAALRKTFTMREAGRLAEGVEVGSRATPDDLRSVVAALVAARSGAAAGDDDVIDPQGKDDDAYRQMAREEIVALAQLAGPLLGMSPAERAAYVAAASHPDLLSGRV